MRGSEAAIIVNDKAARAEPVDARRRLRERVGLNESRAPKRSGADGPGGR
jgi:hypothetical protein